MDSSCRGFINSCLYIQKEPLQNGEDLAKKGRGGNQEGTEWPRDHFAVKDLYTVNQIQLKNNGSLQPDVR